MSFYYTDNPFYVEPYCVGGGGDDYRRSASFPSPQVPNYGRRQTPRFVDFEESGSFQGSMSIGVEDNVDDDADDYIKGIHKRFEQKQWKTFK